MPNGMTEGQWAVHHAENEVTHTPMDYDSPAEETCQICEDEAELLEHHVSYRDRFGLFRVEIVIEVCMECHYKIHKEEGFYEELNPVEHPTEESLGQHENFVVGLLLRCEETHLPKNLEEDETKYRLYKEEDEWKIKPV